MSHGRVIKVECRCGFLVCRYYKDGRGRLIKCFLDAITEDYAGVAGQPVDARPTCPGCGKKLGVVKLIHRRRALKINHGTIRETRI